MESGKSAFSEKKNNFSNVEVLNDVKVIYIEQINNYHIFGITNFQELKPNYQDLIQNLNCFRVYNNRKTGSTQYQFRTKNIIGIKLNISDETFCRIKICKYNEYVYIQSVLRDIELHAFEDSFQRKKTNESKEH